VTGIRDLKHLTERVKKHEASAAHTENDVKFNLFGSVNILSQLNESYRVSIQRHNELVDKNRHILGRIINCIKFYGTKKLPLIGRNESETYYNRKIFLDLVSELANSDSVLDEHLRSATVSIIHLKKQFKMNYWTV
jgi:flagellar biosynthesis regulator FlaF